MLFVTSFICFTSCSNDEDEFYTPQEVDLTLDYTFVESGSMTRATGESVYNEFYESHILTKELTPKHIHCDLQTLKPMHMQNLMVVGIAKTELDLKRANILLQEILHLNKKA